MPDITIQNLRVAPGAGARVPTTVKAYPRADFLLSDADATAVSETSPYNGGVSMPFKSVNLTPNGAYYAAADFTLPSTTDSPDNPAGARWGLFVFDARGLLMYPVAGLDSFWLEDSPTTVDVETLRANVLGTLPAFSGDRTVNGDLTVTGDLQVNGSITSDDEVQIGDDLNVDGDLDVSGDGDFGGALTADSASFGGPVTATQFNGSGGGLTGVVGAGPGGSSSTGSLSLIADSDNTNAGELMDFTFGSGGGQTLVARFTRLLLTFYKALVGVFYDQGGQVYHVRAYGAVGNGTADDTAAIQDAIDACEAAGGGVVLVPPGSHKITATLYISSPNVRLVGCGPSSKILCTFATGHIISATVATPGARTEKSGLWGLEFRDFYIESSVNRTSGAAIYTEYTQGVVFKNVQIGTQNPDFSGGLGTSTLYMWDGIVLMYQDTCLITDCRVYARHSGVQIGGWQPGGVVFPYFSYNGLMRGCTVYGNQLANSIGVLIGGGCGGLHIDTSDIGHYATGLRMDTSLDPGGAKNREIFLGPALFIDSSGSVGVHIAALGVDWLTWTEPWISYTGGWINGTGGTSNTGLLIDSGQPTSQQIILTGGRIIANKGDGIRTSGDGHLVITGTLIGDNGTGANGGHGVSIETPIDFINITGAQITGNGNGTRGIGVRFATGAFTGVYPNVTGNLVVSNGQANFSLPTAVGGEIFEANHGIDDFGGSPTWTSVGAFSNGWANYGAPYRTAQYAKFRLGVVTLRGLIKSGTTPASVAFTLPAGYRPALAEQFSTISNGVASTIIIGTNGDVTVATSDNASVTLSGIEFAIQ